MYVFSPARGTIGGLAIALCFPADIHPVASITRYGEPTRRIAAES